MKVIGNVQRMLYVFGLALMGLSFYVMVLLLLIVGAMSFFSSHAHAQVAPTRAPVDAAGICSVSHGRKA